MSVFGTGASAPSVVDHLPPAFRAAIQSLRQAEPRPQALVNEIPAPRRLAPFAVALSADVSEDQDPGSTDEDASGLAIGRFILLYDPAGNDMWHGSFRVVIYIRAALDPEMGNDPLLASVAWTWLCDALDQHGVQYTHAGGTATRILSESFGALDTQQPRHDVELRASWTPKDSAFGTHMEAWADMVCSFAGLPPVPDGVIALPHIRRT